MFLKRLEIIGFKSFADKVSIEFVPGVTAVVGPNGSGKSNVIDAIRWVLGEQSAKSLRGAKMQDIIFAGSDSRKPLNFAEVTLVLDNTTGLFPLDYTEISVSRRVFRSGESAFHLNGQVCRLKDINDVFTDSGLGKEAFSIISQGRVDEILNSRPEERRSVFDEAAGVLKYRMRKKKAESKLIETDDNLDRILDILKELDDRIEPLAANAKAAERHRELAAELREADVRLLNAEAEMLQAEMHKIQQEADEKLSRQRELEKSASSLENDLKQAKTGLSLLDEELNELQERHVQTSSEFEKWEGRRLLSIEKQRNAKERAERIEGELQNVRNAIKQLEEKKNVLLAEHVEIKQQLDSKSGEMNDISKSLKRTLSETEEEIENLKSTYIELLNKEATVRNELKHIEEKLTGELFSSEKTNEQTKNLRQKINELQRRKSDQTEKISKLQSEMEEITVDSRELRTKLQQSEKQLSETQNIHQQAVNKRYELQGRLRALKSMEADLSGFYSGVKEVLLAKKSNGLNGIEGAVAELISVEKKHVKAVETALGGAMQHIITTSEQHAKSAIHYLKKKNSGRATFLPLDVMKPRFIPNDVLSRIKDHPGYIGTADQLAAASSKYQNAISNLLGATIVVNSLDGASEIAKLAGYRYRIVTLDGDIVNAGGSLTGGGSKGQSTVFSRKAEMETLTGQLTQLNQSIEAAEANASNLKMTIAGYMQNVSIADKKIDSYQSTISELDGTLREIIFELRATESQLQVAELGLQGAEDTHSSLLSKQAELRDEQKRLKEQQEDIQNSVASLERLAENRRTEEQTLRERYTELREETATLREQAANRTSLAQNAEEELLEIRQKLHNLEEEQAFLFGQEKGEVLSPEEIEQKISEFSEAVETVKTLLSAKRAERSNLSEICNEKEADLKKDADRLTQLASELSRLQVQNSRSEVKLEAVMVRLLDEYGLHPDYEVAENFDITEVRSQVDRLKKEIEILGPINPGAVEEYEEVLERHMFLSEQRNDLLEAKTTLEEAMSEMDNEMKTRFSTTFDAVQQRFRIVFKEMFGGGEADLVLTEPDNLLETGVEIMARPPGKKRQHLSLLSGGERALTAITLLFAIIEVRPVPFCILDEVEAALDEANVIRYSKYLRKFSEDTQFIVITHRKGTMEGADVLYGITMQESGVSRLLSVKMSEVPEAALQTT